MALNYTGKECCQGCGKPGSEVPRIYKDSLCKPCQTQLNIGKALQPDFMPEQYTNVRIKWYYFEMFKVWNSFDEQPEPKALDLAFNKLFSVLDRPNIEAKGGHHLLSKADGIEGAKTYVLRVEYYEAIKELFGVLQRLSLDYDKRIKAIEAEKNQVVRDERNRIYNEGVEYGKKLLLQLNTGEISLSDFDKENRVKY